MYMPHIYAQAHESITHAMRVGFSAERYQQTVRKITEIRHTEVSEEDAVCATTNWMLNNLDIQALTDLCSSAEHLEATYARNPESWMPGRALDADIRDFLSRCAVSVLHVNTEFRPHPIINHAYTKELEASGNVGLRMATTKEIAKAVSQLYFARAERAVALSYDVSQPAPADADQRIVKALMPHVYTVRTPVQLPDNTPARYRGFLEARRGMVMELMTILQEGHTLLEPLYDLVMSVTTHLQTTGRFTPAKMLQYGKVLGYLECFAVMARARGDSCRKILSPEGKDSGVKSLLVASVMDYRRLLPDIKREIIALVMDTVLAGQEKELLPEISAYCERMQAPRQSSRYFASNNKPSRAPADPTAVPQ